MVTRDTRYFLLLNVGHFLDHYLMLIFAAVAALALSIEWGLSYAQLLPYGIPGFTAFALCALPMGIFADRLGRDLLMVVFFSGMGIACVVTGFAQSPLQLSIGLLLIGVFGAIYHPVGLAIVTARWKKTGMRLAVNGIWGNFGVGCAALGTGILIDIAGWRAAFIVPGIICLSFAIPYWRVSRAIRNENLHPEGGTAKPAIVHGVPNVSVIACVYLTAVVGSIVFQSTTVALPEIFEERLSDMAEDIQLLMNWADLQSPSVIGALAFLVFAAASLAQLVTGFMLDRYGPRPTLSLVAALQFIAFAVMVGQTNILALLSAFGFMLGVFGQVPVNDFLISTTSPVKSRSKALGIRYMVSFLAFSATLPLIALIQSRFGFDGLFLVLMMCAGMIFIGGRLLLPRTPAAMPTRLPQNSE